MSLTLISPFLCQWLSFSPDTPVRVFMNSSMCSLLMTTWESSSSRGLLHVVFHIIHALAEHAVDKVDADPVQTDFRA